MSRILHILTRPDTEHQEMALGILARQLEVGQQEPTLLLIQDAVGLTVSLPVQRYVLREDAERRNLAPAEGAVLVSYLEMLELIFAADAVITW